MRRMIDTVNPAEVEVEIREAARIGAEVGSIQEYIDELETRIALFMIRYRNEKRMHGPMEFRDWWEQHGNGRRMEAKVG